VTSALNGGCKVLVDLDQRRGPAVPVASEPLDPIYPTKTQNPCEMTA